MTNNDSLRRICGLGLEKNWKAIMTSFLTSPEKRYENDPRFCIILSIPYTYRMFSHTTFHCVLLLLLLEYNFTCRRYLEKNLIEYTYLHRTAALIILPKIFSV